MTIVLFEDEAHRDFAWIALARPLFDLRVGALTLRERVELLAQRWFQGAAAIPLGLCRPHLMGVYGAPGGINTILSRSEPLYLINGRAMDLTWLPQLFEAALNTTLVAGDTLLGAKLTPALASVILHDLREQAAIPALAELRRFAKIVSVGDPEPPLLLNFPWDIIAHTGEQIARDAPVLATRLPRYTSSDAQTTVRGEAVFVAPNAKLEGPLVLDARSGPVIIDANAHIEPFSFIQGPVYIGPNTLIASARIRGETSFGPTCRIGGEVEASVIQGFSNKHHDGFLGHSWMGEWVNIGAMTTNSDLKNTYGTIRVDIPGRGQVDSGQMKLGCFLGDHVKLGIGLHMNGGTVIGTGSNVFGMHTVPQKVLPFTWGGDVFREYRIDGMIAVTRKVMGRRKRELTPAYETMLRAIFEMTKSERAEG